MWKIIALIMVILAEGTFILFSQHDSINLLIKGKQACTLEAKICPDGKSLGRTGPNCEFPACPDVVSPPDAQVSINDVVFKVGDTSMVGHIKVTLVSVEEDSRCPVDVRCVWAGRFVLILNLQNVNDKETVKLTTDDVPYPFGGYYISIRSVEPVQSSKGKIPVDQYRVTLRVAI